MHLCLANTCLHFKGKTDCCLEVKTGGGWKLFFPGIMQEFSRMLLRPTPLQQPTRPVQLCLRTLRVAAPWMPGLVD